MCECPHACYVYNVLAWYLQRPEKCILTGVSAENWIWVFPGRAANTLTAGHLSSVLLNVCVCVCVCETSVWNDNEVCPNPLCLRVLFFETGLTYSRLCLTGDTTRMAFNFWSPCLHLQRVRTAYVVYNAQLLHIPNFGRWGCNGLVVILWIFDLSDPFSIVGLTLWGVEMTSEILGQTLPWT